MNRYARLLLLAVSTVLLLAVPEPARAQQKTWGTVKGRIVWAGDMPKKTEINVTVDNGHCLAEGKLFDEPVIVNPQNKGVRWVFVWLAPPKGDPEDAVEPIHPELKNIKVKEVVVDQPRCMFLPRAIALREGQVLVVKNSSPVRHSIKWASPRNSNPDLNLAINAGETHPLKDLQAERVPLVVECAFHKWMRARLGIFSHPYYAITDADGNFEIPNAPTGNYRLFVYHEGWLNGAAGRNGQPIAIKAGMNNVGALDLK